MSYCYPEASVSRRDCWAWIGFFVAKQFVEDHGGQITIENTNF